MAHPSQNRPSTDMRIQIPTDDEVVKRFLDGQSPRARSAVMRQLIHIFVAEHGDTDVFSVAGSLLAATPGERRAPEPHADPVPNKTEAEAEVDADAETDSEVATDETTATPAAQQVQPDDAPANKPADDGDSDQTPDISEMFA